MSLLSKITGGNKYIGLIALLIMMGLLSTDIFLPSLPKITEYFHTDKTQTVKGLSYYFIALAGSFLFVGNLVDRFGRRIMLLIGLVMYIAVSLLIGFSWSVEVFVIGRAAQGVASAIINTTARTIARDTTERSQMGKVFSFVGMVVSISPMVAPLIGGFIEKYLVWQVSFYFLSVFAGLILLYVAFRLPETAPKKNRAEQQLEKSLLGEFKAYWLILSHFGFLAYGAVLFGFFAFFGSYIGASSFIYTQLGLQPDQFGLIFTMTAVMFLVGSTINNLIQDRVGGYLLMLVGVSLTTLGVFILWALATLQIHQVWAVAVPMMVATLGNGMGIGNAFAGSTKYFRVRAGTATAMQGFAQYGTMAVAVNGMGHFLTGDGGDVVMALSLAMIRAMVLAWAGVAAVSVIEHYKLRLRYF
ncbi:MAG: multidrug effflux MFS transporter [Hydrotalea sp.]|nr:multidrug effflux MFS transporter [Hydrotalea sp.]